MSNKPFDAKGRYVPLNCPECGNGTLRHQGGGSWSCDGLADPEHPDKPLEACTYSHENGDQPS